MINSILLNTANVLYVFGYGVRDVLWLRILAVSAMCLLLPFYANQSEPMIGCIVWQLIFVGINVYWIVAIIRERRPPKMTEEERELYELVFQDCCSAKDMLRLLAQAQRNEAKDGEHVIQRKTRLDQLLLIQSGSMSVQVRGSEVTKLHPGSLVGEVSFLTKEQTIADVIAAAPVRYLSWHRDVLEQLFATKVELKSAIYELIGHDLVQKLISHNQAAELHETISVFCD